MIVDFSCVEEMRVFFYGIIERLIIIEFLKLSFLNKFGALYEQSLEKRWLDVVKPNVAMVSSTVLYVFR